MLYSVSPPCSPWTNLWSLCHFISPCFFCKIFPFWPPKKYGIDDNRCQSMTIGNNRWQLKNTNFSIGHRFRHRFWHQSINCYRLPSIVIDCYRLSISSIDQAGSTRIKTETEDFSAARHLISKVYVTMPFASKNIAEKFKWRVHFIV